MDGRKRSSSDDNLEFYKKVKQAAIEQEKSNRLYQKVRFEKSSSNTKTLTKHSKEQKRFRKKESFQNQGSRDKNSQIGSFGKQWECRCCGEKGQTPV